MFDGLYTYSEFSPLSKDKYQRPSVCAQKSERAPVSACESRLAFLAALALRSLQRDGAGTVDDFAARLGVERKEAEDALARLISYREARIVSKSYGLLYVPLTKELSLDPPGTRRVVVANRSLPVFDPTPLTDYERVQGDVCAVAVARYFVRAGFRDCGTSELSNATGFNRHCIASRMRDFCERGILERVEVAVPCHTGFTNGVAWRVADRDALENVINSSGRLPVNTKSARSRPRGALIDGVFALLQKGEWTTEKICAALPDANVNSIHTTLRYLRRSGVIARRGGYRAIWVAVAADRRKIDPNQYEYGVSRETMATVLTIVSKRGRAGATYADLIATGVGGYSTCQRALSALEGEGLVRSVKERSEDVATGRRRSRYFAV